MGASAAVPGPDALARGPRGWLLAGALTVLAHPVAAVLAALVGALVVASWPPGAGAAVVLAAVVLLAAWQGARALRPSPHGRAVRADDAGLTGLVDRVAARVGIDVPVEVRVVPTAEAALLHAPGGGLVVLLGWPLVRRLSRAQLAAVVAHELGHAAHVRTRLDRALVGSRNDLIAGLRRPVHVPVALARRALACTQPQVWARELAADATSVRAAGAVAVRSALAEVPRTSEGFDRLLGTWTSAFAPDRAYPEDVYAALDAALADPGVRRRVEDDLAVSAELDLAAPELRTHPPDAARLAAVPAGRGPAGGAGPADELPVVVRDAAAIEAWCVGELCGAGGRRGPRPQRLLETPPEHLDPPVDVASAELRAVTGARSAHEALGRALDVVAEGTWERLVERSSRTRGLPAATAQVLRRQVLAALLTPVVAAQLRAAGWRRGSRWTPDVVTGPDGEELDLRVLVVEAAASGDVHRLRALLGAPLDGLRRS